MNKELEAVAIVGSEIVSQHIKATPYGLEIEGKPSTDEWYDTFMKVSKFHGMSQFYLGDLMVCAEYEWGDKYTDLIDLTGYDYQSVANYASIARRFTPQFREEVFTHVGKIPPFSAFKAVQGVDDDRAKYFLRMVVDGKWSIRKLEEEVKRYKNGGDLPKPKEKIEEEIPSGWEAVKTGKYHNYVPAPENVLDSDDSQCLVQFYKSELELLQDELDGDDRFLSILSRIETALEGLE